MADLWVIVHHPDTGGRQAVTEGGALALRGLGWQREDDETYPDQPTAKAALVGDLGDGLSPNPGPVEPAAPESSDPAPQPTGGEAFVPRQRARRNPPEAGQPANTEKE